MVFDAFGLLPADDAVRRAEEGAVDEVVGFGDVAHIAARGDFHALKVVHGVVAP